MGGNDKTGSADEGFLARWSRLKSDGGKPVPGERTNAEPATPAASPAAHQETDAPSLVELTKLPRIEDLTSGSDFAAFLQKGVPEELKRLALRKAWSLDPAIRDFVEVAENQYDWNSPGGAPGFGEINAGADMKQLLAQAIGEVAAPKTDAMTAPGQTAPEQTEVVRGGAGGPSLAEEGLVEEAATLPGPEQEQLATASPSPPRSWVEGAEQPAPARSRHGGALPQLPVETARKWIDG